MPRRLEFFPESIIFTCLVTPCFFSCLYNFDVHLTLLSRSCATLWGLQRSYVETLTQPPLKFTPRGELFVLHQFHSMSSMSLDYRTISSHLYTCTLPLLASEPFSMFRDLCNFCLLSDGCQSPVSEELHRSFNTDATQLIMAQGILHYADSK